MITTQIYNFYSVFAFIAVSSGFFCFLTIISFYRLSANIGGNGGAYIHCRRFFICLICGPMDLFKRATFQTIYLNNYKSINYEFIYN